MSSAAEQIKPVPAFSRDTVRALDDFHRHLAEVLAGEGLIRIVPSEAQP